jgi:phosphoadenosine phosphosulfate reductase
MKPDDEELKAANELLGNAPPEEILRWAVKRYHPKLMMATAFGAEGCCIIDMLSRVEPGVLCINIDTGYQFPETLALRERLLEKYGIAVDYVRADTTVPEYEKEHGGPLYEHRPDQCCYDRKVRPLQEAVKRIQPAAWISAIRQDQTTDRGVASVVQWDAKFQLVKVNPLLKWTKKEVWGFIHKNQVPYNVLHDQDYPSIGCWPCTRAVRPGESDRDGRWAGKAKKECGLHVVEHKDGSGI